MLHSYISYQTLATEFSSLLLAPQHYHSYQSAAKEVYSHLQPLSITPLISLSQRNFILTFSPSTFYFVSVPRKVISSLLSTHLRHISYQSLAKEFPSHSQPLNITFLISPLQRNSIFTFNPSTLHFVSVPCKRISSSLSSPRHYISYQSLAKEFLPYFQTINIIFLISHSQKKFILTFNPQHYISSQSVGKEFHPHLQPLNIISYQSLTKNEILSLLPAPQRYISYQSTAKEIHSHFQSLYITFVHFLSAPHEGYFILTFNPSTLHFLSVPHKGISFLLSAPQH